MAQEEASQAIREGVEPGIRDAEDAFGFLKKRACQYLKPRFSVSKTDLMNTLLPRFGLGDDFGV